MAVYKKTYRGYDGPVTPEWSRFLVLTRYTWEDMRRSRFLTLFLLGTLIPPLVFALIIYLRHNLSALELMGVKPSNLIQVNTAFFLNFLGTQSMFAFFLNSFIGPGLVSPDLSNNAVPLYLSRPFSRQEYVLGRMSILVILFSLMTWIPGLMLFGLQSYVEGWEWFSSNVRLVWALTLASMLWILMLSLLSLSVSAWVKWKPIAGGLLFGIFFVAAGFGAAINAVLRTKWGSLINISYVIGAIWTWLFGDPKAGAIFFRVDNQKELPVAVCWIAFGATCVFCLWLLNKKIGGVEVVK
ncbi:MAG: hypothetical protein SFV54_21550 [Bryobacteraceae bacterium]|nr:hypothetical protein [Bryobacteraceae bacterium]